MDAPGSEAPRNERTWPDAAQSVVAMEGVRRLRRVEYDRLVDMGCFNDEKAELLYGVIVPMSPQGVEHSHPVRVLTRRLLFGVGDRAEIQVQSPFAASDDSEPEPDVAVTPFGDWDLEHPGVAYLIVEVAVSSQTRDRKVKAGIYAAAGVTEYWLVDVPARLVEVYREPAGDRYASLQTLRDGETLSMVAFPDVTVNVTEILPRRQ